MSNFKHYLIVSAASVAALSPVPTALCNAGLSMSFGYAAAVVLPAAFAASYLTILHRRRQASSTPQLAAVTA